MLFEKNMESLRKRMDLELVTNPTRAKKIIAKPTTRHWDIISENLVSVRKQKLKLIVDRPIYLGYLYFGFIQNNHAQIPLRGDYEQVCKTGLHRYWLFYIPLPNSRTIQRYGGQLECVRWLPTIQSTTPPLKDECQGSRQDEGRMLEFGTARICWASSQNVQYPPQW